MAKREPRSITRYHILFAAASALLLLSTLWVFQNDHYQREYPAIQESYDRQEKARLEKEREEVLQELANSQDEEKRLQEEIQQAAAKLQEKQALIAEHQAEMVQLRGMLELLNRHLNFAGTDFDVRKYEQTVNQASLADVDKQEAKKRELFNLVEKLQGQRFQRFQRLSRLVFAPGVEKITPHILPIRAEQHVRSPPS